MFLECSFRTAAVHSCHIFFALEQLKVLHDVHVQSCSSSWDFEPRPIPNEKLWCSARMRKRFNFCTVEVYYFEPYSIIDMLRLDIY